MKRALALALLVGLAACNRHGVADVTLDAAAAQRNATSAKTLADLQAAADASRGPTPAVHGSRPAAPPKAEAPAATEENEAAAPAEDASEADTNG